MKPDDHEYLARVAAILTEPEPLAEYGEPCIPRFLLRNAKEWVSEYGTRIVPNLKFGRERKADGMTVDIRRHEKRWSGCGPAWD